MIVGLVAAMLFLVACGGSLPSRVELPPAAAPEVGVAYGVELHCTATFALGNTWWRFEDPMDEWPPRISESTEVGDPYAVPGIVTMTGPSDAVFRADVHGAEFRLSREEEASDEACL